MRGPIPSNTTNPVVAPTTSLGVAPRSCAICMIPGVNIELASGLNTGVY